MKNYIVYIFFVVRDKLIQDHEKVNQLESKLDTELAQLKEKKIAIEKEIRLVNDIENVKDQAEAKKIVNKSTFFYNFYLLLYIEKFIR